MDGGVDQGPWLQERVGGGVGAMANFATCEHVQKDFFEGCPGVGGTHRSWPGGRGGRPRALIPGEGVREGGARASVPGG